MADASNAFGASFSRPGLIECGSNMHARRYFKKALDAGDHRAVRPLAAFKRLYIIEDELRGLSLEDERKRRQERTARINGRAWTEAFRSEDGPPGLPPEALEYCW